MVRKAQKTITWWMVASLLTIIMMVGCQNIETAKSGSILPGSMCGEAIEVTLYARQNINVGTVTAWNDTKYLYVTYTTTGGWVLFKTYLAVAISLDSIPQLNGDPIPSKFLYKHEDLGGVTEDTYTISLTEVNYEVGDTLYIAAHATVGNTTTNEMDLTVVSDEYTLVIIGNVAGTTYPVHAVYAWEPYSDTDPSVWDQSVDYQFSADWIWESYRAVHPVAGDIVEFEKTFEIEGQPTSGILHITCVNGYMVYLNGDSLGSAQLHRGWKNSNLMDSYVNTDGWQTVEHYDISDVLLSGENILEITGVNEYFAPPDYRNNLPGNVTINPAGLIFELDITSLSHIQAKKLAWGNGKRFPGSVWAMYFTHTVQSCQGPSTGQLRTQTQGGWGSMCHGDNPGCYLHANFDAAFPDGLTVGCSTGCTAHFTSAQAITDFLPQGRTPRSFTQNHMNPTSTEAGVLAGQVVALTLNVQFDLYDEDFGASGTYLADLVIVDEDSPSYGMAVEQVLNTANSILGGCYFGTLTTSEINECVHYINNNFVDGKGDNGFLRFPK